MSAYVIISLPVGRRIFICADDADGTNEDNDLWKKFKQLKN